MSPFPFASILLVAAALTAGGAPALDCAGGGAAPEAQACVADGTVLAQAYSCTPRKTCKQMSSCAEARYRLEVCGDGRLDGDHDGVPCETLCGGG